LENEITYPHINSFLAEIFEQADPLLKEMEELAHKNYIPIIQPESAQLLKILCYISKPERILEIGTAIGYSTIILARSMAENGIVDTVEINEDMIEKACGYIKRAGLEDKIRILNGDAEEVLQCLGTPYDFIFLDAAKGQYIDFLPHCLRLLKPGGVFVTDNVLYRGMVAKKGFIEHKHRTITVKLKEYINLLCRNEELITSIVPAGDGIAVCVKKRKS
jgi:predicted O-methyltransferase YrrM